MTTLPPYDKDNLERIPMEYYLKRYFDADPYTIANRLGIVYEPDQADFELTFLGENYHLTWPGYRVLPDEHPTLYHILTADTGARILTLRYLLYASVFQPNGDFMSFRELPSGELFWQAFEERCVCAFLEMYGSRPEAFRSVMESLEASRIRTGDVGYELEVYDSLYIRFILWKGDEEFGPSAQILFSSNFPAAFGTYDLAEITEMCLRAFAFAEKLQ